MSTELVATFTLFFKFAWLTGGQGCDYKYTHQPPQSLSCNPYMNNAMYIECAIKGPDVQSIQWYFSYSGEVDNNHNNTIELHNSSKYKIRNFTSDSDSSIITSQLTVIGFHDDSDAGAYWCTGILDDGSTLQTLSSELVVEPEENYSDLVFCFPHIFLKSSDLPKCVSIVHTTELNSEPPSSVPATTEPPSSVPATTIISTLAVNTLPEQRTSPWAFNNILIATLCFVAVLVLVCVVLMIVIGLQCRKRRKMRDENRGFHESTGPFLRSITQSAESQFNRKEASGEYAEIGPAIIATVAQHMTDNPHYSSIGDSMLKPPQTKYCTNPLLQHPESHIVENPYDALTSPKEPDGSTNETDKSYSRLDRVVSTGGQSIDKRASMCGEAIELNKIPNQTTDSLDKTPTDVETAKATEHHYHILEEPKDVCETSSSSSSSDTESWTSSSSRSVHLPKDSGISLENHEAISSPAEDEERYQTSDNFSTHDTTKNTYDHLEACDVAETKYKNVEYLEPVSMIKVNKNSKENLTSCKEESETSCKYNGDYERDPSYMERIQTSETPAPHYQTLIESTMEPSDNYTKLQSLRK